MSALNSFGSGMGSVSNYTTVAATKNGVATVPQIRTASPASQQQNLPNKWSMDMTTGAGPVGFGVPISTMNNTGQVMKTLPKVIQTTPAETRPNVQNSISTLASKQPVRISSVQHPQQPGTVQLPPGITIPPGMVLARNQTGQLLLVNSNSLSSSSTSISASQVPVSNTSATIINSTSTISPNEASELSGKSQSSVVASATQNASQNQAARNSQSIALSQEDIVNVRKCRNFLTTLIKLASAGGQSAETVSNVKKLVQDLIDDKIETEYFTQQLQIELNSAPQPYLVPFLKRSLPLLRLTMMQQSGGKGSIPAAVAQAALRASSVAAASSPTSIPGNTSVMSKTNTPLVKRQAPKLKILGKKNSVPDIRLPRVSTSPMVMNQNQNMANAAHSLANVASSRTDSIAMPPPAEGTASPRHPQQKWASSSAGGTFKDDDDINDVASMAGVNLMEESARILATNSELVGSQIRSCKDLTIVNSMSLTRKITDIVSKHPSIQQVNPDVIQFTAHAVEARIKNLMEKMSLVAYHRMVNFKETDHYEASQDVKSQLKFLLQLDQLEKKRHAESEREVLMRAMKSRSKNEDPEQLRLKQRAKEMQQLEMERMQIQNADETARNAIGPRRKKTKIDMLSSGGSLSESKDQFSSPLRSTNLRPRIKRVNVRDLIFVMEQEKDTNKSKFLYKSYLK